MQDMTPVQHGRSHLPVAASQPSKHESRVPKTVYALWNTGFKTAPPLVQNVLRSWQVHAPDFDLRLLDQADLDRHMQELGLGARNLTIQAASDILRTKLLCEGGGYWIDATCLLSRPLSAWAPAAVNPSGFFAFARPGQDRLISSWFLASERENPAMLALLDALVRYWDRDRIIYKGYEGISRWSLRGRALRRHAISNRIWAVDPAGGADQPYAPYFFFHYLFEYLVRTDTDTRQVWNATAKKSAFLPHAIGHAHGAGDLAKFSTDGLGDLIGASPVHKLNWRLDFPGELFELACPHTRQRILQ